MTDDATSELAPRHTRRGKIGRGLLAGATLALGLAVLLTADGGALARRAWAPLAGLFVRGPTPLTVTVHPPVHLAASAWQRIALPFAGGTLRSYAAAPGDPATVFACSNGAVPDPTFNAPAFGPVALWRTRDSGAHWTRLVLPGTLASGATTCEVHIARDDPRRVAVLEQPTGNGGRACGDAALYLSVDGGDDWTAVPHTSVTPAGSVEVGCDVLLTSRHLFFWYLVNDGPQTSALQHDLLERSDDDGRTWVRADNGLGDRALFFPTLLGADALVTELAHLTVAGAVRTTELWIMRDAGAQWQRMSAVPDFWLTPLAAQVPGVDRLTAEHPLYSLVAAQIPSDLLRLRVVSTSDGRRWSELPPLPVTGSSSEQTGLTNALGVDAAGRLLAFGVSPTQVLPPSDPPVALDAGEQLWVWDPAKGRWETAGTPLSVARRNLCGSPCWIAQIASGMGPNGSGHGTYVWVQSGMNVDTGLYRLFQPSA